MSFAIAVVATAANAQTFDHTHAAYDAVLKAHVSDGRVDYRTLKADPSTLNRYLVSVAGSRAADGGKGLPPSKAPNKA
jgi:hypothetical protein